MKIHAPLLLAGLFFSSITLADDCNNAMTQSEINQCTGNEYRKADEALNKTYKTVMSRASDAQQDMLKKAENAWLEVRDADCAFISSGVEGGSAKSMVHNQCLADKTHERNAFLESLMQCEEGDLSCPLPPQG